MASLNLSYTKNSNTASSLSSVLAPYVLYTFRQYLNSCSESGKPPTNYECGYPTWYDHPLSHFHPHPRYHTPPPPSLPYWLLTCLSNPPPPCPPPPLPTRPNPSQPPPPPTRLPVLPPLPFYIPFPRSANPILVPIPRFHPHPSPSPTRPFILILQPTAYTIPYDYMWK